MSWDLPEGADEALANQERIHDEHAEHEAARQAMSTPTLGGVPVYRWGEKKIHFETGRSIAGNFGEDDGEWLPTARVALIAAVVEASRDYARENTWEHHDALVEALEKLK